MKEIVSVKRKKEETTVRVEWFAVITERPEEFVEELEKLCRKFCSDGDYFFNYEFEG